MKIKNLIIISVSILVIYLIVSCLFLLKVNNDSKQDNLNPNMLKTNESLNYGNSKNSYFGTEALSIYQNPKDELMRMNCENIIGGNFNKTIKLIYKNISREYTFVELCEKEFENDN